MRWLIHPSKTGLNVFLFFVGIITLISCLAIGSITDQIKVDRCLQWWVRLAPNHPMNDVKKRAIMSGNIARSSKAHGVPWSIITAMVLRESSARDDQIGPAGEIGPLQVYPATARHYGCSVSSSAALIDCGARILRKLSDKCGSIKGGLTAYGSNKAACTSEPGTRLHGAVQRRLRLAKKLRKVGDDGN